MKELGENIVYKIGKVEANNDPLALGRAKVRLIGIHDEDIPVDHLPWSSSMIPVGATISPPELKSFVICWAVDEALQNLVIIGTIPGITDDNTHDNPQENRKDRLISGEVVPSIEKKKETTQEKLSSKISGTLSKANRLITQIKNQADKLAEDGVNLDGMANIVGSSIEGSAENNIKNITSDIVSTESIDKIKSKLPAGTTEAEIKSVIDGNYSGISNTIINRVTSEMANTLSEFSQSLIGDFDDFMKMPENFTALGFLKASKNIDFSIEEPSPDEATTYPNNKLMMIGGCFVGVDGTPGKERIQIFHKSGSHVEIRADGEVKIKSVNNSYIISQGDSGILTTGNTAFNSGSVQIKVQSDCNIEAINTNIKSDYCYIEASKGMINGLLCPFTGTTNHQFVPPSNPPTT